MWDEKKYRVEQWEYIDKISKFLDIIYIKKGNVIPYCLIVKIRKMPKSRIFTNLERISKIKQDW